MSKISPFVPYLFLILLACIVYYKFIFLGKIPFPGDLLVGSYSPWFDYYKIPVQNPLISDVFSQFFLWKYLAIDSFKQLQWPLWNPYSFMGTPLLATYHSATLYPLNLLILIPKYVGWGVFILSQTLISFITMYLLLFYWTRARLPSFLGAVIFGLSGLMTTWLELGTAVHAMAWLPLCIYSVELFLEKEKLRYILFLIISFSLIILAGNAQVTTYSLIIISAYSVVQSRGKRISKLTILLLACILAILLCALQLIPSFDLLQKSIRLTEVYTADSNFGLLKLKDGLRFFIADFFGNPVTGNYWGTLNYHETSGFVGTLALPLIIYAYLFLKRTKRFLFFLILLPLTLILAFDNPFSQSIYQLNLPLLTSSYASRILFISTFAISILSAFSVSQILKSFNIDKFSKSVYWSWAIICGVVIGIFLSHFMIWDAKNLEALKNLAVAERNSLLPLALISAFLILINLINRFKSKIKPLRLITLLGTVLFILTTFDLTRYFLKYNPFISSKLIFPNVPMLNFLKNKPGLFRVGREHAEILPPNTWIAYNLQSYEGYDPIYLNQYGKFMHFLNGGDVRTGNSTRYAEVTSNYTSPYLDAANTKFFVAISHGKDGNIPLDSNYRIIFKDKSAVILENPEALERAYFAPAIVKLPESKIMDLIMSDQSFDPRKNIALSKDLLIDTVSGEGNVQIIYYSPNLIKINTTTQSNEVLVLADQYEDGWQATIDGRTSVIGPANLIFRAIKAPAGSHQIIFSYWPKIFDLGLKISLITLFLVILLTFYSVKIKRF